MSSLLATVTALVLGLASASGPRPSAGQSDTAFETYDVVVEGSEIVIEVGRAGLFKMFGHDHRIRARDFEGRVEWNAADPTASRFQLEVDASSLYVADEDVSEEDREAIQADMESKALSVDEHATIVFESTRVVVDRAREGKDYRLEVRGTLTLRGVAREIEVPLVANVSQDRFTAAGELELPSDEWGVPQISVAGGTVKTKKELPIQFTLVAVKDES